MKQKFGGVSIKGNHELNQDYFICDSINDISFIVMSDGLGSKLNSHFGAKTICDVIFNKISLGNVDFDNLELFVEQVHNEWLSKLKNYDIKECYATCLFCILKGNKAYIGRLGDGFICLLDSKNQFVSLDDNLERFVNETNCLNLRFEPDLWKLYTFNIEDNCTAVIFTDGLSIGNDSFNDIVSFVDYFQKGYSDYSDEEQIEDMQNWVSKWYGQDDKTIAYIIR